MSIGCRLLRFHLTSPQTLGTFASNKLQSLSVLQFFRFSARLPFFEVYSARDKCTEIHTKHRDCSAALRRRASRTKGKTAVCVTGAAMKTREIHRCQLQPLLRFPLNYTNRIFSPRAIVSCAKRKYADWKIPRHCLLLATFRLRFSYDSLGPWRLV